MDGPTLEAVMTSLSAAVGAYGHDVLTRAEDSAADETVKLGQRILARLRLGRSAPEQAQIEAAVTNLADHADDEDYVAAVRVQMKEALKADPTLSGDLTEMVKAAGVVNTASGNGSVVIGRDNSGIVSTGDGATITQSK